MNMVIEEDGFLFIERPIGLRRTKCCQITSRLCGDWCALFGEPESSPSGQWLDLCCSRRLVGNISDLRKKRP